MILLAFAAAAVAATAAALWFLRPYGRFWSLLSAAALAISATGLLAVLAFFLLQSPDAGSMQVWSLALLRLTVGPLLAGAFFLAGLLAPNRRARGALLLATLIDASGFAYAAPSILFGLHWAFAGAGDPLWRPIADRDGLIAECVAFVDEVSLCPPRYAHVFRGYTEMPQERWPAQVRALYPQRLRVDNQSCRIIFRNTFQNLTWGYSVYPAGEEIPPPCERPNDCGGEYVWQTDDARIVRWEWSPG